MATVSGTLTSKVTSTASSPNVNYSATYVSTRTSKTTKGVSVKVDFSAWLPSSASTLGTGIKLTIFARINGGAWKSVVLKSTTDAWSGTSKHNASITLTTNTTDSTATVEWYVSRTGSTYSGTAGTLGSSSNPKSHKINLPVYTSEKYIQVYVDGTWKSGIPYVFVNGTWKKTTCVYVRANDVWKSN